MKKLGLTIVLAISALWAQAERYTVQGDSLIVQFGNNTRMVIHAKDKKDILSLRQYDLNKIVRDMGAALDSTNNETYVYINDQNGRKYLKDTVLVISRKDGEVKITVKDPDIKSKDRDNDTISIRDEIKQTIKEEVREAIKEGRGDSDDDDKSYTRTVKRRYKSPRNGFDVLVGLNAYGQNEPTANYNSGDYDLLPFGSRFVSLSWVRGASLSRGQDASFGIDLGIDVSWYNLMFDGNNTVRKDLNRVSFPQSSVELYKSKLTAAYVNMSLMPTIKIHNGPISYLSVGMYGGYRIDSYTKTQEARRGRAQRDHSNLYLNDFRYGISGELGIRNFPDLFVQYDMGTLFQSNKGPSVRMVSFGVRL